jgi:choline dehydrogenase
VGVGPLPVNIVDGVRQSTAIAYLQPARERPNLEIRADVTVDRVELRDGRARAVILADRERLAADQVVVAAGAIGSPAILQRSGIGPADQLARLGVRPVCALEGVGRNLRDHPMIYPRWTADADVVGRLTPPKQVFLTCSASGAREQSQVDLNLVLLTFEPGELLVALGLVRPYSVGRLELRSADPYDAPRIHLRFFDHPEDLARMVTGVRLARSILASAPMTPYVREELWPGPDATSDGAVAEAVLATPTTYAHPVGTCAMGRAGTEWAVVGQRGEVHGVKGLRVVDASIMPTIPAVPTNLTTIMLAERCADALRNRIPVTGSS